MIEEVPNWPLLRFDNVADNNNNNNNSRTGSGHGISSAHLANCSFSSLNIPPTMLLSQSSFAVINNTVQENSMFTVIGNRTSSTHCASSFLSNEKRLRVMLNIIVCPIVIGVGTIGNLISFLTLTRPRLRHQTTAIYLAILCLNDLGAIWFGLLRHYLLYGYGYEVRSSDVSCKFHILLTYWFMHNSSVLLAAVGVQRYLFVCHNTKFRSYMTNKSTFTIIGMLSALVLLCEIHYPIFYTMTLHPVKKLVGCTVDRQKYATYYRLRENVIGYMQLIVFYMLPFIILLISNVLIIRNLVLSTKRMKSKQQQQHKRSGNKRRNISVMMIAISVYFLVLTTPAQTYIGFAQFVEQRPTFLLEWTIITLVYYTNHASNFVLYFLTGNLFREEMYSMFKEASVKISTVLIAPCFPNAFSRIRNNLVRENVINRRKSSLKTTIATAATTSNSKNNNNNVQKVTGDNQ